MNCVKCGFRNPLDMAFCGKCGSALRLACPSCAFENPPENHFCGRCGNRLDHEAAAPPDNIRIAPDNHAADASSIQGERKFVTALFADIKGSMEMMETLDPEQARAIVDPALQLMIDAAHRYDGYVVQSTGDGIFALFGAPLGHEDHAQRAVHAALAMLADMHTYAERLRERGQRPVEVRIGINTGEMVVRSIRTDETHVEYTPIGHATSLAARMQALAPSGSIVITPATRALVEEYFSLRALGPATIKGVREAVEVYEVTGLGAVRTRFERSTVRGLTRFVGRATEIIQLRRALELSETGHGQIVAAIAEPGMGKSRLFHEFKSQIPAGWLVLEAFSLSFGAAAAYVPLIHLLKGYFGIADDDGESTRRAKVGDAINALDTALYDTPPFVLALLGDEPSIDFLAAMDPAILKHRTVDAIKRILLRQSLERPLVIIFEDLHWIDSETQALLDLLAESIGSARILLLVNYRPGYHHEWTSRSNYIQLRLDPLGRSEAAEMLTGLLGAGADFDALKRLIISRTEGNPFFIEEIVQSLKERSVIVGENVKSLSKSREEVRIPATIQGILSARIDRLGAIEKDTLQTLAVLGREFPLKLVRKVISLPLEKLTAVLAHLQGGEFIQELPAAGYRFKHALTRDVAYNSMLSERRKAIHLSAAAAISALYGDRIADHYNELARHYEQAGDAPNAINFLFLAGRQASQRSAFKEAIGFLTRAMVLIPELPDNQTRARLELGILVTLGQAQVFVEGMAASAVERTFTRARELSRRSGDSDERFQILDGLRGFYMFRFEHNVAEELEQEMLAMGERAQNPRMLALANSALGQTALMRGQFAKCRTHYENAIALLANAPGLDAITKADLSSIPHSVRGHALWFLGYADQARSSNDAALARARESGRSPTLALALLNAAELYILIGDASTAMAYVREVAGLSAERGFALRSAQARFQNGWATLTMGYAERAIEDLTAGVQAIDSTGAKMGTLGRGALSEALAKAGRVDEALAMLAASQEITRTTGTRMYDALGLVIMAEMHSMKPNPDYARVEALLWSAIALAREQEARTLELRATLAMARGAGSATRRAQARAMLETLYTWFTEGFDTPYLRDARAFLDARH